VFFVKFQLSYTIPFVCNLAFQKWPGKIYFKKFEQNWKSFFASLEWEGENRLMLLFFKDMSKIYTKVGPQSSFELRVRPSGIQYPSYSILFFLGTLEYEHGTIKQE
jgi:hypothetical protein